MRAGRLRHNLTIKKPKGQAGFGLGDVVWEVIRQCSGDIKPLASGERVNGQQVQHATSHQIKVRYSPDAEIDSTCIVEYKGRTFEIKGIVNDEERDKELLLLCDETGFVDGESA